MICKICSPTRRVLREWISDISESERMRVSAWVEMESSGSVAPIMLFRACLTVSRLVMAVVIMFGRPSGRVRELGCEGSS